MIPFLTVDKLNLEDIPEVYLLIDNFVQQGLLQPWSVKSIAAARENFWVVRDLSKANSQDFPLQNIAGCCALFPVSNTNKSSKISKDDKDLLELRCVAVREHYSGRGVAKLLVEKMIRLAIKEKKDIFCFSRRNAFFENLGFFIIERKDLHVNPALDNRYALNRVTPGLKIYFYKT